MSLYLWNTNEKTAEVMFVMIILRVSLSFSASASVNITVNTCIVVGITISTSITVSVRIIAYRNPLAFFRFSLSKFRTLTTDSTYSKTQRSFEDVDTCVQIQCPCRYEGQGRVRISAERLVQVESLTWIVRARLIQICFGFGLGLEEELLYLLYGVNNCLDGVQHVVDGFDQIEPGHVQRLASEWGRDPSHGLCVYMCTWKYQRNNDQTTLSSGHHEPTHSARTLT